MMQNVPNWLGFSLGIAMLIVALGIFFYLGRRRFYRRNKAGMEEFTSFGSSVLIGIYESFLYLIMAILAVIGVFQIFMHGVQLFFQ